MSIDLDVLEKALQFNEEGFTPWNEEKELFIAAARAYLESAKHAPAELEEVSEEIAYLRQFHEVAQSLIGTVALQLKNGDLEKANVRMEHYRAKLPGNPATKRREG